MCASAIGSDRCTGQRRISRCTARKTAQPHPFQLHFSHHRHTQLYPPRTGRQRRASKRTPRCVRPSRVEVLPQRRAAHERRAGPTARAYHPSLDNAPRARTIEQARAARPARAYSIASYLERRAAQRTAVSTPAVEATPSQAARSRSANVPRHCISTRPCGQRTARRARRPPTEQQLTCMQTNKITVASPTSPPCRRRRGREALTPPCTRANPRTGPQTALRASSSTSRPLARSPDNALLRSSTAACAAGRDPPALKPASESQPAERAHPVRFYL